jgi:hypothetical protein
MRAAPCLAMALALAASACGGDPDPSVDPPAAPSENDPAYTIAGVEAWYLIGDALTPGQDELTLRVQAPAGTGFVDAWLDGAPGERLRAQSDGFYLQRDLADLGPGVHELLFAADGADTAFARVEFRRTHPLYVLATTDWDYSDAGQAAMDFHDDVHAMHPGVKITHFIGPYTFTDPAVSDAREAEIVDWVKRMRDEYGDEIGLHIHPYCNFVEYAGLTCNTTESTVYENDTTGYTIGLWAYDEEAFGTLLRTADTLFEEAGWGKPVTFRAGGWTATIDTLRALADDGFVADTSALNWAKIEEWIPGGPGTGYYTLYQWNMEQWSSIGDTSQPYYPNDGDVLSSAGPRLSILEVPDNLAMVDYVSVEEMDTILRANWDGSPLDAPTTAMMGWHPSMSFSFASRVQGFFDLTDQYLASEHKGPVVYALLKDMPLVFSE